MNGFPFELQPGVNLIIIEATVNDAKLKFSLNTGASHTVIDKASFILADGEFSKMLPLVFLETASREYRQNPD